MVEEKEGGGTTAGIPTLDEMGGGTMIDEGAILVVTVLRREVEETLDLQIVFLLAGCDHSGLPICKLLPR